MGFFAARARKARVADSGAAGPLGSGERLGLPRRFEAVGEALASGSDPVPACRVVGQDLARDGASLTESMAGLRDAWQSVGGGDPDYVALTAFLEAWSETTLGYLHQISCEDPLTGLASQAHLRSRISDLYRARAGDPNETHALVVCELALDQDPTDEKTDHFTRAMRLSRAGETARTVFPRDETIARLGIHRIAVVAPRDERLGRRVRVLRTLLSAVDPERRGTRVWIEGLPGSDMTAVMLLDELSRR